MTARVADEKGSEPGRFDPQLKEADDGFFLSRWMNVDAMKDFFKGAADRPSQNQLSNLPEELNPIDNLEKFREAVQRNRDMSLAGIIFKKLLLPDLLKAGFIAMSSSGMTSITPLITKQIIGYVDTPNPTPAEQTSAYGFGGAWVGTHGARVFSKEYVAKIMFQQALKAQQILNVEILRKITRLRPDSRSIYTNGDELKILTGHVSTSFSFIRACSIFVASPTKLVTIQILIYNEIGYLGFVMIGIIVLVGLIQVLISRRLSVARRIQKDAGVERSEFNLSSFASIKHVRQLGWQDYIMKKNKEIRQRENEANQKFYMLQNVSSTLANLAPTIIILIILLVQQLTTYQIDFTIAKVYTVLALVGTSYGPARNLFEIIFLAIQGFGALKKIDALLKLPETQEVDQTDKQLQPGQVLARKGYLGTFEEQFERLSQLPDRLIEKASATQGSLFNIKNNPRLVEKQLSDFSSLDKFKIKMASLTLMDSLLISPGERYIILGSAKDRRAFLYAIMGKLKTVDGKIRYGGQLSYLPESPWIKKDTVRSNVLFGLEQDSAKLKKVYEVTLLSEEIRKLPKQDLTDILQDQSNLTTTQVLSIAIARVLYAQPNLLLIENTFDRYNDQDQAKQIFLNICKQYPSMTIIMTTHPFDEREIGGDAGSVNKNSRARMESNPRELLIDQTKKQKTFLVLIDQGFVKEIEPFPSIHTHQNCVIAQYLYPKLQYAESKNSVMISLKLDPVRNDDDYDDSDNCNDDEIDWYQVEQRSKRLQQLKYKVKKFTIYLLKYSEGMSKDQIAESLLKEANNVTRKKDDKPKRMKGVPLAVYVTLFRSVGYTPYILLILLLIATEGTRIFSDWWLGTIQNLPWQIDSAHALYIYIGLSAFYSLLSLVVGLTAPKISRESAQAIAKKVCNSLAKSRLSWFEGKNTSEIASNININTEEIFRLNLIARNIIRNILLFVAAMVLVGFNNPSYAGIAVAITIVAIVIMLFYIQQERETLDLARQFKEPVEEAYDQAIKGTEAMKSVNQLDSYRDGVVKPIYRMQVHKNYDKNINHGMAILTKLTSMIGVTGTAFLTVGSNSPTSNFTGDPAVAGTSITFTQRLNQIMVGISRDFKGLEQGLRDSVGKAYNSLADVKVQRNGQPPPPNWPVHNGIKFVRVSLEEPDHSLPALIEETFAIAPGKKVVICGMRGGRAILMGISRQIDPESGRIEIGGVDVRTIKPTDLAKKVMLLDEEPFFFNGTIRDNLSPKEQERVGPLTPEEQKKRKEFDNHLKLLLKVVGIWDSLPTAATDPRRPNLDASSEGSFSAFSFYDEDSKSRMAKLDRQEEDLKTEAKLYYKLTNVKKQLSCGIRQRLNIVRALLLRPRVLLCHNHLSYLRPKTRAMLDRLLITNLSDTTIVYYVPKPDPKEPMLGVDRVYYSSRGELLDMGAIDPTKKNTASVQYFAPELKMMEPERPLGGGLSLKDSLIFTLKQRSPELYEKMKEHLKMPVQKKAGETVWESVDRMIQAEYKQVVDIPEDTATQLNEVVEREFNAPSSKQSNNSQDIGEDLKPPTEPKPSTEGPKAPASETGEAGVQAVSARNRKPFQPNV